ncbi:dephospho-CoA kinase [Candidatus Schneideria nysicola]|uniref:dephospho-CoA kinase n=1 Tax=Candidatus Schneideria nysicola TaxID=1081631 RepID=UPI001CAA57EF|nr:dephospho-CoA kinase [Candidatus Schneideria nysicola]UAJ65133.1 dephospho-CoA kinase [Candidatus Schneideria nysicola]
MAYIIAITGGIGSGKSTVAHTFAKLGIPLVDTDIIARQVVKPNSFAFRLIVEKFGLSILRSNGSLDRINLKKRIFKVPSDRIWMESLLHPVILKKSQDRIFSINSPSYIIWIVPLLIENRSYLFRANRVLLVDTDYQSQIQRAMKRDNMKYEEVKKIILVQSSRQNRLSFADDIIDNSGYPQDIRDQVIRLHLYYLKLAKKFQITLSSTYL